MKYLTRAAVSAHKTRYPKGTRVKLIRMCDPYSRLAYGDTGTVAFVDDIGTIHVDWDNGSTLGVVLGVDSVQIIDR